MDFVKQQISSAVKNTGGNNANNNSDPSNTKNDKDNNSIDSKSTPTTVSTVQGGPQQAQDLANLRATGDSGRGKGPSGGGLLPADLSDAQLSQLGSQLGAAVAAESAKNPDKSAEALGADTLKRIRDLQSQAGGGATTALQGGVDQMAEKEAVEQGRKFLAQQQPQQQQRERGGKVTIAAAPAAATTANKPPVTLTDSMIMPMVMPRRGEAQPAQAIACKDTTPDPS